MKTIIENGSVGGAILALAISLVFMSGVTGLCLYLGTANAVAMVAAK